MIESCLGVISYEGIDHNFGVLCSGRPIYMLPFGGRYRLVDFALSNIVNHGIRSVALYTGDKTRSTMDHIGDGRPWELNRRLSGLFIFPPQYGDGKERSGNIYQYYKTLDFYIGAREKYIFMMNPRIMAKVDLSDAFNFFVNSDADITIMYKGRNNDRAEFLNNDKVIIDERGRLVNIGLNLGAEPRFNQYLHMGFMKKEAFLKIVNKSMESGEDIFFKQAMIRNSSYYKINTYEYNGHVENIKDVKSYYDANMNLLNRDIFKETFFDGGPVLTKPKDEPSTFYSDESRVDNSLLANGCIIEGTVENSVLFRGVRVGPNAIVSNSIIMQGTEIKEDAVVVNSIVDKYVTIEEGASIAGSRTNPYIVEKSSTIRRER